MKREPTELLLAGGRGGGAARGGGGAGGRGRARGAGRGAFGPLDRFLLHLLLEHDLLDARLGQPERAAVGAELAVLHHLGDPLGAGQHAPLLGHAALALQALVDGHRSVGVGVSVSADDGVSCDTIGAAGARQDEPTAVPSLTPSPTPTLECSSPSTTARPAFPSRCRT